MNKQGLAYLAIALPALAISWKIPVCFLATMARITSRVPIIRATAMIMPTTIILLLLSVGGIFKGNFDMFYNLVGSNGLLYNYTDVIDTLTFRALISSNDFGMSAAVGLYQSVLCFITVVIVNKLVGLYDKDYTLF